MSDHHFIPGDLSEAAAAYLSAMNMPLLRDKSRAGWYCSWASFGQGVGYVFLSEEERSKESSRGSGSNKRKNGVQVSKTFNSPMSVFPSAK